MNPEDQKQKPLGLLPKEQLTRIYEVVEKLKQEGKDLTDPRYEKLVKVLKQQYLLIKQKQSSDGQVPLQSRPTPPTNSSNLTSAQFDQLRAQIYALKHHLQKDTPVPTCLYPAIRGNNTEKSLREYELYYKPTQPNGYQSYSNQPTLQKPAQNGLDIQTLFYERERRIHLRIKSKFEELKELTQSSPVPKLDVIIQLKTLNMIKFQKDLRSQILNEHKRIEMEKMNRRSKRFEPNDGKTLTLQNSIRRREDTDPDLKKKNKHKKYLNDVMNHRKKIQNTHRERQKVTEKLNKDILAYFEKKTKMEREKKEKEERARLKALKENDSEAYYEMLVSAKEERLLQLIKQTDECLSNLGAQLVNERIKQGKDDESDEKSDKPQGVVERFLHNEKAYYTVAHRLTEKIECQPSTLTFGKLKEYQISGLQWLVSLYNNKLNGILADEMGLGKTIQTVSLITYLMEYKSNQGPFLVIVPLSTIENWRIEFERWAPHVKLVKYSGAQSTRKHLEKNEIKEKNFNVLLTQYEYITKDKRILKKIPWEYIIIDEGHRIKNKDCKLVLDLKQYKSEHRLLLTGTPLQNDLKELWALLNFLLPTIFDNSSNFETWFNSPFKGMDTENKVMQMTEEENLLIIQRLHQVLRPFLLRREKKDVEDQLPEKVEKVIRCHLSVMQKKLYEQIQNKSAIYSDQNGKGKPKSLNNSVMQLRKVCNHPFLFYNDWSSFAEDDIIRTSGKFELLNRMLPKLKSQGHKVLIFSQMTSLLDILGYYMDLKKYEFLRLDGNVKAESRGDLVKKFNDKDSPYFVFLLSTRAGGLGLNLQGADTVIIFDSDWNPQQDLQAMARAHRIGQTKAVRVFVLVSSSPVEEKIFERAQEKRDAEAKVIKAGMFDQSSTSTQRQEMLETILLKADESYESEVPDDEQLNRIIARAGEFEIFEQMDKELDEYEKNYWGKFNLPVPSKLMTDEKELPSWLLESFVVKEVKEDEDFYYGRGLRKSRNQDQSQFMETINDEDQQVQPSNPVPSNDDGGEFIQKKRKRGETNSKRKKKKKSIETPLQRLLISWYENITMMYENDNYTCALFMELPSKSVYPDYYQLIKKPICFDSIKEKIEYDEYPSIEDMQKDIELMKKNADTYNQSDSIVCVYAKKIMDQFLKLKKDYEKKNMKKEIEEKEEEFFEEDEILEDEEEEDEEDVKSEDDVKSETSQPDNFFDEEEDEFVTIGEETNIQTNSFDIFGDQSQSMYENNDLKEDSNFINW